MEQNKAEQPLKDTHEKGVGLTSPDTKSAVTEPSTVTPDSSLLDDVYGKTKMNGGNDAKQETVKEEFGYGTKVVDDFLSQYSPEDLIAANSIIMVSEESKEEEKTNMID